MKNLFATLALTVLGTSQALATPFSLDYILTDLGGSYQYDFVLTLDNNDGSHTAGDSYDWFAIGSGAKPDGTNITSPFAEGSSFFTSIPSGWSAGTASGFHDGPYLAFGASVSTPYWAPNLGDSIAFTGVSATQVNDGELYFAFLSSSPFNQSSNDSFVANRIDPNVVPLPAGLPLLAGALGLLALRKRRKS